MGVATAELYPKFVLNGTIGIESLSLYQVWEGEVLFEGAAYDYQHGPQQAIAQLDKVWVVAEVFERQSAWVGPGQAATVELDYLPGTTLQGKSLERREKRYMKEP